MPAIRKVVAGEPAPTDAGPVLVARYEQLRLDALAGSGHGWRWGRALLERQGLAAWIGAWDELDAPAPLSPQPVASTAAVMPAGTEQMVAVLAAMALACTVSGS